jgi:CheY-like chemotaxis protein
MGSRSINVLVADDQENMRQLFARVLNSLGYSVDVSCDGRDCLIKFAQQRYDVIFLDLVMPEIDGETVLRWIRTHYPQTHVVISSVQDDEEAIRTMLAVGATAYLVKPFTSQEIQNVMRGVENRRTAAGLSMVAASA